MDSFEDLGIGPELADALAAEGAEWPTPLQAEALPIVRRGSNVILRGGSGSGVGFAWAAGLIERLLETSEGEDQGVPTGLVLAPDQDGARDLARSLSGPASGVGLRVAALSPGWLDPTSADLLVATAGEAYEAVRGAGLKLDSLLAVVVVEASAHEAHDGLELAGRLMELAPAEAQRIVTSLPLTDAVETFARQHAKKVVEVPIPIAEDEADATPRGALKYLVVEGDPTAALLRVVSDASPETPTLIFCRTEDRVADVADLLTLYGHQVGRPGDPDTDLWVAADPEDARARLREAGHGALRTISLDVPVGADQLDQRHGQHSEVIVFAGARELEHLRSCALLAHYTMEAIPARVESAAGGPLARLRDELGASVDAEGLAPYLAVVEPLLERHSAAEVAAGALRLLHTRRTREPGESLAEPSGSEPSTSHPSSRGARPFVRLFLSIGSKDRVRAGDIVGAIAGESGVPGEHIGKIDIRETFSLVEVEGVVADRVIRALNGTTIRGRSVRADLDRGTRRGGPASR